MSALRNPPPWSRAARRISAVGGAAATALVLVALPALADDYDVALEYCPPCLSVVNEFVRADVDPRGFWVEGTTGGDPGTALDDRKRLLYGFSPGSSPSRPAPRPLRQPTASPGASPTPMPTPATSGIVGTSFTTVRIRARSVISDFVASEAAPQFGRTAGGLCPPSCTATCPPECDAVLTVWDVPAPGTGRVAVTETLETAANPFTGRDDVIRFEYLARNLSSSPLEVGFRSLLDVRVGDNDGAPYIIPGLGALTTERSFSGDEVPSFWLAFESPTYASNLLRAVGILDWQGLVRPDRFVVAKWGLISDSRWDYAVDPSAFVTNDSAVALYWEPTPLQPGQSRTVRGAYGVAGDRGGVAFLSSPVAVACEGFSAAFFVTNFELTPLVDGQATLRLPPGLGLAPGESMMKAIGTVNPGDTASVVWELRPLIGTVATVDLLADAVFAGGRRLTATAVLEVDCPAPATLTPTPSRTPTATPTFLPTNTPTRLPSATPGGLVPCPSLIGRVPAAAIAVALAQPDRVSGYNLLCNPNRPAAPHNHFRRSLTIRNLGVAYHPLLNPIVFKCGCP